MSTTRDRALHVYLGRQINEGLPCPESWWTRCQDHRELSAEASRQKYRQAVPTEKDARYDPSIAATADWLTRRAIIRAMRKGLGR